MRDNEDIAALSTRFALSVLDLLPVFSMYLLDLLNDSVYSFCHFVHTFTFWPTPIFEDVPISLVLLVNLVRCQAFVFSIIPFPNQIGGFGGYTGDVPLALVGLEEELKGLLRALAG